MSIGISVAATCMCADEALLGCACVAGGATLIFDTELVKIA
jgi:hypothetical protein